MAGRSRVLDLLFNNKFELSDCITAKEDGGESSYLGDSPLDAAELVSLSEGRLAPDYFGGNFHFLRFEHYNGF